MSRMTIAAAALATLLGGCALFAQKNEPLDALLARLNIPSDGAGLQRSCLEVKVPAGLAASMGYPKIVYVACDYRDGASKGCSLRFVPCITEAP